MSLNENLNTSARNTSARVGAALPRRPCRARRAAWYIAIYISIKYWDTRAATPMAVRRGAEQSDIQRKKGERERKGWRGREKRERKRERGRERAHAAPGNNILNIPRRIPRHIKTRHKITVRDPPWILICADPAAAKVMRVRVHARSGGRTCVYARIVYFALCVRYALSRALINKKCRYN